MISNLCSRLRSGYNGARFSFCRRSGRRILGGACFHLIFRTEFTPDDEEAMQLIFERLL